MKKWWRSKFEWLLRPNLVFEMHPILNVSCQSGSSKKKVSCLYIRFVRVRVIYDLIGMKSWIALNLVRDLLSYPVLTTYLKWTFYIEPGNIQRLCYIIKSMSFTKILLFAYLSCLVLFKHVDVPWTLIIVLIVSIIIPLVKLFLQITF